MKRRFSAIVVLVLAQTLAGSGKTVLADEGSATVPVQTIVAAKQSLEQSLELTGGIAARKTVTVYSKVTGVIEKLPVERGMHVDAGDVIAVVEHKTELAQRKELLAVVASAKVGVTQAEAAVKVVKAALAQTKAQLENAALEKIRIENLYKEKTVPKQKYDAVIAQYKIALAGRDLATANVAATEATIAQAQAALQQAQAALERLDVRIADYTIRAPFAGVITARYVDQGAMDNPFLPIVQIMDVSSLKVNCAVAQVNASKVRFGQKVQVTTDAYPGVEFLGKVYIVNPALDAKTRTLPVEVRCSGKKSSKKGERSASLKPGMFVKVSIDIGSKTTLAVPRDCLMRLPGTGVYYVFIVKDGKAQKRTVRLGISQGNLVEIASGLKEGQHVVIKGQGNLKTGTAVVESR